MAFGPIAHTIPQYEDFPNNFLKAFKQGTTTPVSNGMAVDKDGGGSATKFELNSEGFPKSSGGALIIPFIDEPYDLWLFPTAAEADANDTSNAKQFGDDLTTPPPFSGLVQSFDTLSLAIADTGLVNGDTIDIKDVGSTWDIVLASTVTIDGVFFVQSTGVGTLALVYRVNGNTAFAEQLGIIPGSGQTTEIGAYLKHIYTNNIKGVMLEGQYDVTANILSETSTAGKIILSSNAGNIVFNYTGSEITQLMHGLQCNAVQIKNVQVLANSLIAAPIDFRKDTGSPTGNAILMSVNIQDAKQTALANSAVGILISGKYQNSTALGCVVNNVSRVNVALSCAGISLIQTAGIVKVALCEISNISTPSDSNADGLVIFGDDVATITSYLPARAEVHNNVFEDCQGRFIKMQVSDMEIHANTFKLSDSFSTITEWRGIDFQTNNGDCHANTFRFGNTITFGSSATLFGIQNTRNDGGNKDSFVYKNRCTTGTAIPIMFGLTSDFGTCNFVLEDNSVFGAVTSRVVRHRVTTLATTDKINIHVRNNRLEQVTTALFDSFDDIDFGQKLYVEFLDNENLADNNILIIAGALTTFSPDGNFRIRNNSGFAQRVNWVFDHDDLLSGNGFFTGGQVNSNKAPNVGSNFYHVETDGYWMKSTGSDGANEDRRTTLDGVTWNSWVAV